MRRRRYLALATAAAAGTAGCLGENDATDDPGGSDEPNGGTTVPSHTTTGPGTTPGSNGDQSAFPPDDDGVDRVVWADDVDDPSGRVVLEPDLGTTELPASGTFTLHNRTDRMFHTNFYDWRLYRREGGRWHRVAPLFVNQPLMQVPAGGRHAWEFSASATIPDDRVPRTSGTETAHVQPVGGGTYAFAASGWFPDQTATPTHEHETVLAAEFDLAGPDLELEPSDAVQSVDRDGSVVSVEAEGRGGDESRLATYVLSQASDAEAVHVLITETAYREWPLRDALAHVESGVEEVRLRAPTSTHPAFGVHNDDPPSFSYDGRSWRVTVENVANEG